MDIKEQQYRDTYHTSLEQIRQKRKRDPLFRPADLENLIETELINEGNDWVGRGELFHITQKARIAAYEVALEEWMQDNDTKK
ncbi:MAG: hypothetical protein U5R06_22355 [candidate division KSB1 bacterium]|nr:hypothetical protein [candidate division KSB1 bacterium]